MRLTHTLNQWWDETQASRLPVSLALAHQTPLHSQIGDRIQVSGLSTPCSSSSFSNTDGLGLQAESMEGADSLAGTVGEELRCLGSQPALSLAPHPLPKEN